MSCRTWYNYNFEPIQAWKMFRTASMLWEAYNLKHTTSNIQRSLQEESMCQARISRIFKETLTISTPPRSGTATILDLYEGGMVRTAWHPLQDLKINLNAVRCAMKYLNFRFVHYRNHVFHFRFRASLPPEIQDKARMELSLRTTTRREGSRRHSDITSSLRRYRFVGYSTAPAMLPHGSPQTLTPALLDSSRRLSSRSSTSFSNGWSASRHPSDSVPRPIAFRLRMSPS